MWCPIAARLFVLSFFYVQVYNLNFLLIFFLLFVYFSNNQASEHRMAKNRKRRVISRRQYVKLASWVFGVHGIIY